MGSSERNQRIQSSRTQTSNMKTLLLLSILGLALISADLQTEEDRYIEEADVVAVDDSAEAMDDLKDEMEDSRRKRKRPTRTYYRANFNANEPIAAPTDGVVTSPSSQQTQIESFNKQTAQIVYFAPNGENDVTGTVTASTTSAGELKFDWDLAGLEESTDASGKHGIHVHYRKSCDSEVTVKGDAPTGANKGHYYVPASPDAAVLDGEDPWASVKYISDGDGKSTGSVTIPSFSSSEVSLGADDSSAFSRVVIVHNKDGSKRGCGLLAPSNTVTGTVNAYIKQSKGEDKLKVDWDMEGLETKINSDIQRAKIESFNKQTAQIRFFEPNSLVSDSVTGSVTASTTSAGELKLEWDLAGLPINTDANGKNGIHVHYGTSCDSEVTVKGDAPTDTINVPADPALEASKGHYYNPATSNGNSDPWANVKWESDAHGKSTSSVTIPSFSSSDRSLGADDFSA